MISDINDELVLQILCSVQSILKPPLTPFHSNSRDSLAKNLILHTTLKPAGKERLYFSHLVYGTCVQLYSVYSVRLYSNHAGLVATNQSRADRALPQSRDGNNYDGGFCSNVTRDVTRPALCRSGEWHRMLVREIIYWCDEQVNKRPLGWNILSERNFIKKWICYNNTWPCQHMWHQLREDICQWQWSWCCWP